MKTIFNSFDRQNRRVPRPRVGILWAGLIAVLLAFAAGCEQPIYDAVEYKPSESEFEFAGAKNERRQNWPIRGAVMTVAKPPPLAYLMSYSEPVPVPDFQPPAPALWQSEDVPEKVRQYLRDLFEPLPTKVNWVGKVAQSDFAGPQAYDLSIDGKRLLTVTGNRFALFRTSDGKLIGRRDLPGNWTDTPPTAIRFAPKTKDFLVASAKKVCRISSKNGELIAEIEGPGEGVKKWLVADDESYMLMLTDSGRLYAGDAGLQVLERLHLSGTDADATFHDVGMSFDGIRILVTVGEQPRTYLQENGRIVDLIEYPNVSFSDPPAINGGLRDDLWASRGFVFYTQAAKGPNSNGEFGIDNTVARKIALAPERETGTREMFWRPAVLQSVRSPPGEVGEWAFGISQRLLEGKMQWVVHDVNVRNRFNSIALPLDSLPQRFVADRMATHFVVCQQNTLRIASREPWRSRSASQTRYEIGKSFGAGEFKQLERLCDILHGGDYWSRVGCSADCVGGLLEDLSTQWARWIEREQIDGQDLDDTTRQALRRCETWSAEGGFWAKTLHAHLKYRQSWRARENVDGLGGDRWARYNKLQSEALSEMKALLEEERPTALTLGTYIGCYLESNNDPESMDSICRRFVDLYPRSTYVANKMGFKMLPQWYGELGDGLGYLVGHARLYDEPFSGLMYALTVGEIGPFLNANQAHWRSLDVELLDQGIDRAIELDMPVAAWFYNCQSIYKMLVVRDERLEKMTRYLLSTTRWPIGRQNVPGSITHSTNSSTRDTVSVALTRL